MSTSTELVDRLGSLPFELRCWDGTSFTSVLVPANKIGDCSIRRGRATAGDQATAATLSTTLVDDGYTHALNQLVRLQLTNTALDALYGSHTSAAALRAKPRFTGVLTDAGSTLRYASARKWRRITAAGLRARLERIDGFIDLSPGTSVWQVINGLVSFITEARAADLSVRADFTSAADQTADATARTDESLTVIEWDDSTSSIAAMIDESFKWFQAVLIEKRSGGWDILTPNMRRGMTAIAITAADLVSPAETKLSADGLANRAKVTYGNPAAEVTVSSSSIAINRVGVYPVTVSTKLSSSTDATNLATDIVARRRLPYWTMPTVTVDLLALFDAGNFTLLRKLLEMDYDALASVSGLPADDDVSDGDRYIIGVTERISRSGWSMDLNLVSDLLLAPALRWNDIAGSPSGPHWNDLPATLSWLDATQTLEG